MWLKHVSNGTKIKVFVFWMNATGRDRMGPEWGEMPSLVQLGRRQLKLPGIGPLPLQGESEGT